MLTARPRAGWQTGRPGLSKAPRHHTASPRGRPRPPVVAGFTAKDESTVCYPGSVSVDNTSHARYTKVTVESADYPGLLRVIAWVMNGLGLRVHTATLTCTDDGLAEDVFWVTDFKGLKPSNRFAEDIEERLSDFLMVCQPDSEGPEPTEYACGNIDVSNSAHPQFTQLTINAAQHSPGLLLEMTSVITGQQITIRQAVVVSGDGDNPAGLMLDGQMPTPEPGTRALRFWLTENTGSGKLDYANIVALVYTMRLVMGHGKISTSPPNTDINLAGCACSAPSEFNECDALEAA